LELFDFQAEDVAKLAPENVPHRLIASDMGTGKTFVAGAIDLLMRKIDDGNTLVVAPASTLDDTWGEFFKANTELKPVVIDPKRRAYSWDAFTKSDAHIFVCHWEVLRLMPELQALHWQHVIADEVHRMKNRKAQQTQALKKITRVTYKTALGGTPNSNGHPFEMWSVLNWLYPKLFPSYWKFYERYTEFTIQYPQGYRKPIGPKNEKEFQEKIEPFTVRRLKKDVLKDLPDKYYTKVTVELHPTQRKAYNMMKDHMIAWIGEHEDTPLVAPVVIAQLTRLMQFAIAYGSFDDVDNPDKLQLEEPSSKLDALMELLEDAGDEQVVVFTKFKGFVKLAEKRFKKEGISYVAFTGDTPQVDRGNIIKRFQSGQSRVFIGTIAAGGVGITLHSASTVIFVDRDWSPALNAQAEDRLHRIGQKNAVQVIDIIAKDTIDRGRHQMLELKYSWIKKLLGDK
jgi:SNF2 family DNA or RNA helicase